MVYGAVMRLAARNATPEQLGGLSAAQDQFSDALRRGSAADRALANIKFHEVTGEMAANIYLLPSFNRLLIVGTGAMLTAESVALATGARDMGADAILLASPPYAVPSQRENALNALAIDKAANLPVMLYNYPAGTGTMMGDDFLDRVGRSRYFCGIKESSGDINRVRVLARDCPHSQLGCGTDDQAEG